MKKALICFAMAGIATCAFAADGAEIYKKCVTCHGKKAEMVYLKKVPALNTIAPEQRLADMKAYKAGEINGGKGKVNMGAIMKAQMAPLSDEDIAAVNEYITSLGQ